MRSDLAIDVVGLGKRYVLGTRATAGALLGEALSEGVRRLRRGASGRETARERWALRDVSFEVRHGEVVGIIGRNGSGKSTLLQIQSRITDPTQGRAEVRGRVGSLLEVGTGFHPDLTGRENIFVNGAILGMRRVDIVTRFDEIVAFAGIEPFLDTAVKHYSSGMQMRLAFAVAAHLDPPILVVDEVLAVGDAEFQRRCLGKMKDVQREGRTVLLVSHQMGQIRRLSSRVLWLDQGRVRAMGETHDTIRAYESALLSRDDELAAGQCFRAWDLADRTHVISGATGPVVVRVHVSLTEALTHAHLAVALLSGDDDIVAGWAFEPLHLDTGTDYIEVTLPTLPIAPGLYRWSFTLYDGGNNLTGGRLVERWMAVPELGVDVETFGHRQDALAGVLNVPATVRVAAVASPVRGG